MSDIVRTVEEEFDDEGNLVRRTTTEYGKTKDEVNKFPNPVPAVYPDPLTWPYKPSYVGDVWPYSGYGQIVTGPEKYTTWNEYNYGTYARRTPGGTDKDREGVVVE